MIFTKDIKNLALVTFITVLIWVIYELYTVNNKSTPPTVYDDLLKPLDPELDIQLLESLQSRQHYYE